MDTTNLLLRRWASSRFLREKKKRTVKRCSHSSTDVTLFSASPCERVPFSYTHTVVDSRHYPFLCPFTGNSERSNDTHTRKEREIHTHLCVFSFFNLQWKSLLFEGKRFWFTVAYWGGSKIPFFCAPFLWFMSDREKESVSIFFLW
jgi:hypothetical protein